MFCVRTHVYIRDWMHINLEYGCGLLKIIHVHSMLDACIERERELHGERKKCGQAKKKTQPENPFWWRFYLMSGVFDGTMLSTLPYTLCPCRGIRIPPIHIRPRHIENFKLKKLFSVQVTKFRIKKLKLNAIRAYVAHVYRLTYLQIYFSFVFCKRHSVLLSSNRQHFHSATEFQ